MHAQRVLGSIAMSVVVMVSAAFSQDTKHSFILGEKEFLLDGKPFQIISGEMHPARIPREYWKHRIQMAKALGCNTIAAYIFWNCHESEPGVFDFETGNRDLRQFFRLVQEEGLWALLRPGPYVCAEWEFGGLPPYLLRVPDIKVRCTDPRYMAAVERYLKQMASLIRPLLCGNGGPLLMILVEGMGRINFAQSMIDRKGITDRVTLNGMTLMNWQVYNLPLDEKYVQALQGAPIDATRRGVFFKGAFALDGTADTYVDMSNYRKGIVWINGRNLGRYWEIGPQKRLYCPAPWLTKGRNEIVVFDLLQNEPKPVCGRTTLY